MEFISFRADKQLKKQIDDLANVEKKNKSNEYREVFLLGLEEKRKNLAIKKYREGEASLGKAAEMARLATWEFVQLLKDRNTPLNLTAEDVLEGVKNL